MTAETSNARWDVVAERQAWYEQQIALAEGQWAAAFLDRWECGDDVPSKEHYVALWLAERAAPPPAAAEPKTLPVPTHVYLTDKAAVIVGDPQRGWDEEGPDAHNCDAMGCASIGPHVLARVPFTDERALSQPAEAQAQGGGEVGILRTAAEYHYAQATCPRDQFGNTSNHRNPRLEAWHRQVADAITATAAPPSAPVGVDAPGSRAWMAEVCRAAALSLAAHGVRNDQLSKVADWIAQQPAAVDGAVLP